MTKKPSPPKRSVKKAAKKPAPKPTRVVDPGAAFCKAVDTAIKKGVAQTVTDEQLRRVLTAAVKAYAAKSEDAERELVPFLEGTVTATETVVAACAMIRAAGLNLFDVAMWFRRPVAGEL